MNKTNLQRLEALEANQGKGNLVCYRHSDGNLYSHSEHRSAFDIATDGATRLITPAEQARAHQVIIVEYDNDSVSF